VGTKALIKRAAACAHRNGSVTPYWLPVERVSELVSE
jgi:hypothetical protein